MNLFFKSFTEMRYYLEVSEPKCLNPVLKSIDVYSLRLGGLHLLQKNILINFQTKLFVVFQINKQH